MDFLAEGNLCGQSLLRLVSRGNAIVAELLRLSKNIPLFFLNPCNSTATPQNSKYAPVVFEFDYLNDPDSIERKINSDTDLLEIDIEFQENFGQLIERVYSLFESIWKYYSDINTFFSDVRSGFYIQHSLDGILFDSDGKQLLSEAIYLYGIMLLFLEYKIPGPVRERFVVAHCRRMGEATLENFQDVCRLARATSFLPKDWKYHKAVDKDLAWFSSSKVKYTRPENWPEAMFARFPLPQDIVRMVIGRLQSDDVYHMTTVYPNPEHRSTRLSGQAAMLYVLLYFCPSILNQETSTMREIVDRYFLDNWIITLYMGHVVDLSEEWRGYPAAKGALDNVLQLGSVHIQSEKNRAEISKNIQELQVVLKEGVLTESYLLDNFSTLFQLMRQSNTSMRWRMLHRQVQQKKFKDVVLGEDCGVSMEELVTLLLLTAQLEFHLRSLIEGVLETKGVGWARCRKAAAQRTTELADYFTGNKALTRVQRNESLMAWFKTLTTEIERLNYEETHATVTGRKIQNLIHALQEVEQFDQLDNNLQVKAFLEETRGFLLEMVRTVGIQSSMLAMMDTVSDLSYAWDGVLQEFIPTLHARVQQDPTSVTLLRAMFLKLSSILDIPLVRINQCSSPDTISVAEYYSSELVEFVRSVLEVIPASVFEILQKIVTLEKEKFKPLPNRLESIHLKDYALLDERYELAKLTHQVSKFTEGILHMEKTLLGVIQVDPRKILEEGIRTQLVLQISSALHLNLEFTHCGEMEHRLLQLKSTLFGYRRAIEYIQDYIDLPGMKIWQEELSRVINYNTELACQQFKTKQGQEDSKYQNGNVPIPVFNNEGPNFMTRVLNALLELTDSAYTIYSFECGSWFMEDGTEICGIKTFAILDEAVDVIGIGGLDTLLGHYVKHKIEEFVKLYSAQSNEFRMLLENTQAALSPEWRKVNNLDIYSSAEKQVQPFLADLVPLIGSIGQGTLLRKKVANQLQFSCRLSADLLHQALGTFDKAVVKEIQQHCMNETAKKSEMLDKETNSMILELSRMLRACGMSDPCDTIYITTHPLEGMPLLFLLLLLHYIPKMKFDRDFGSLIRKKNSFPIDGGALTAGMSTILRQFHLSYTKKLLQYIGQYVQASYYINFQASEGKGIAFPVEIVNIVMFAVDLCKMSKIPRSVLTDFLPAFIVDATTLQA